MGRFGITSNLHAGRDILQGLEGISDKLGLADGELTELVVSAICHDSVARMHGAACPSVFRHEGRMRQLKKLDDETVPMEYLALVRGTNIFFSIE